MAGSGMSELLNRVSAMGEKIPGLELEEVEMIHIAWLVLFVFHCSSSSLLNVQPFYKAL